MVKISFFSGSKTYWSNFPGNPNLRAQCLKIFSDHDGFRILHSIYKNPETPWLGIEALNIFTSALLEVNFIYILIIII